MMKIVRILMLVTLVLTSFTLVGCVKIVGDRLDETYDLLFDGVEFTNVQSDLNFPTEFNDVNLVWTSSNPDVLANDGKVNRSIDDVQADVVLQMSYGQTEGTYTLHFTVKGTGTVVLVTPVPTNLQVNALILSWDAISGAESYNVYISKVSQTDGFSQIVFTNSFDLSTVVTESGTYLLQVTTKAFGQYASDSETAEISKEITVEVGEIVAPSASNLMITDHELTWAGINGASSYRVYLNGEFVALVNNGTSYNISSILTYTGDYAFGVETVAFDTYTENSNKVIINYQYTLPAITDIKTIADLHAAFVSNQSEIKIGADLDGANYEWEPVATVFTGTLDGQNYTISNLNIVGSLSFKLNSSSKIISAANYAGLVATVGDGASFKNLVFDGVNIAAYERSGVLAGAVKGDVTVDNVVIKNLVTTLEYDVDYHGAIFGRISGGVVNINKVSVFSYGFATDATAVNAYIEQNGDIVEDVTGISTATGSWGAYSGCVIGGIDASYTDEVLGVIESDVTITNAYLQGTIVIGDQSAGGVIGRNQGKTALNNLVVDALASSGKNNGAIGGDWKNSSLTMNDVVVLSYNASLIGKVDNVYQSINRSYASNTTISGLETVTTMDETWWNAQIPYFDMMIWSYNQVKKSFVITGHYVDSGEISEPDHEDDTPAEFSDTDTDVEAVGTPLGSTAKYANVPSIKIDNKTVQTGDIVVSASATVSGAGTIVEPTTLDDALSRIEAGNTIFLLAGTYTYSTVRITLNKNGTANKYLSIVNYNDGYVKFDFSNQPYGTPATNERGIQIDGNYWYLYGLTIYGAADNGIFISGNYNIVENCILESNRDTGLQISRRVSSLNAFNQWPHDNLVKNCTSFNNCDVDDGEDADGFAAKLRCGNNNTFDGCISYNNSDDGWDLYTYSGNPIGRVIILNCIAFNNGKLLNGSTYADGDMNGFKLGGSKQAGNHYLENCIACFNGNHGFTDNSNPGPITLVNCTSFANSRDSSGKKSNWDMNRNKLGQNYFTNILSVFEGGSANDKFGGTGEYCFWYNNKYYYVGASQTVMESESTQRGTDYSGTYSASSYSDIFVSTVAPDVTKDLHTLLRNADGSINLGDFLKLREDSPLYTMGKDGGYLGANLHQNQYESHERYEETIALIEKIPATISLDANCLILIEAAQASYDDLTTDEKASVTNYQTLVLAQSQVSGLKVSNVIDLIAIIPSEPTASDLIALNNANNAYLTLTSAEQANVTNYQTLVAAQAYYETNKISLLEQMISQLGTITLASKDALDTIASALASLSAPEIASISNYALYEAGVATYNQLNNAKIVSDLIELIDETITIKSGTAITAASLAYDRLTTAEKDLVATALVAKLTTAIADYNALLAAGYTFVASEFAEGDVTATLIGADGMVKAYTGTTIKSSNATFNETQYSVCIDVNGAPKNMTSDYIPADRYVSFTTSGKCTIQVYAKGTSTARTLQLSDGTSIIDSADIVDSIVVTFNVEEAGTYYLYSKGSGIKIYVIDVH